jgi:3-phenylpropionate/trans-cinnamate dioxygenase ferredoxin reductase subunit
MSRLVVVGGGLAGGTAVTEIRERGFDGSVVLVGQEPHLPYERPPLSKGYLMGNDPLEQAFVHEQPWYADHDVDLRLGTPVSAIDLSAKTVTVGDEGLDFDKLLLATGCSPRRLPAADDSGVPVHYLRTIEDSERIRAALQPGTRVGIIGAGWIGLEVASAARNADCAVTVVESADKPLLRVLGPEVADVFAGLHREHGVDLRTGASISDIGMGDGHGVVALQDGSSFDVDLLVVGVGVLPNTELAESAGLEVSNGVVVDERLRASHPDVYAAGDVASAYHPLLGSHVRVEHWDNAIAQGRSAGRNLAGGEEVFDQLPYFFTDQYDLGIEYVGHVGPDGYDEVVLRGDVEGRVFTAFWLRGGEVLAGMHANDWDAIDHVRRIVSAGKVETAALRDDSVDLAQIG